MIIAALVKSKTEIIKFYSHKPINVNILGLWQAQNVEIGYKTPDNIYEIVKVIPFTVPENKKIVGEPSYSITSEGIVENYQVEDIIKPEPIIPPVQKIILAADFISRFTDEEYSNIQKAALAQMQVGVATLQKWIDVATTDGYIDLDRFATNEAKQALVAANLLTQERADIIFSIQENEQ